MSTAQRPDPHAILERWLIGRYIRADGQVVTGRTWDEDTQYRYRLLLAGTGAPAGWRSDWFTYIADDIWHPHPLHIQDWATRLTNPTDGQLMAPTSRARAVSAVRSFYDHCSRDLGASSWNLPARRVLAGPASATPQEQLSVFAMDALRTAADRYRGPHAERARLAVYLTLAGLRPGQSIALDRAHINLHDQAGPSWRLPEKNNSSSAVGTPKRIPRPVVWAITDYLPARTHRAPHSTESSGPLLLSYRGNGLERPTFAKLLREVAATHPDLEELAADLRPDVAAHSPSPFATEGQSAAG